MKEEKVIKYLKKHRPKLYTETNEKFVERVLNMLYYTCGCGKLRSIEVLEEALKEARK